MEYKVGQVFYLVGSETAKVIPFRVVEEITRTTLEGQEKIYIAELPDNKRTNIDVSKLKGHIFNNLETLREHMLENAKFAIDSMIKNAHLLANKVYQNIVEDHQLEDEADAELEENKEEVNVQSNEKSDIVKVDIGNGVMAKVNLKDLEKVSQI